MSQAVHSLARPRRRDETDERGRARGGVLLRGDLFEQLPRLGVGRIAPQRDLQGVDRLLRVAAAQVDPSEQQMRLALVRREIYDAPQFRERFLVPLLQEQAPPAIEVELGQLALIALP